MAAVNVGPSSWTCEVVGDFTPVFDNFLLCMTTPSPDDVLQKGERLRSEDELDDGKLNYFPLSPKRNSVCIN